MSKFKKAHSLEHRIKEAGRIQSKYSDKVPVIVEKSQETDVVIADIDKNKFLVPYDMTVSQFISVIRKRIKLKDDQAIFIFINNTLPPASALMSYIFKEYKDEDGFLYITYSGESTFGN